MDKQTQGPLLQEWITLQNNYEQSETLALFIKIIAVLVCLVGFVFDLKPLVVSMLLLVLWLQDAIWKTFQGRTEQRLLKLEQANSANDQSVSLQFYSNWEASRSSASSLVRVYLSNALRPTIAYPYVILLPIYFLTGLV